MTSRLTSLGIFSGVIALSGAITFAGLGFTADTVVRAAALTPVAARPSKPELRPALPVTLSASALNIAMATPVGVAGPAAREASIPHSTTAVGAFYFTVSVESLRVRSGPKQTFPQVFGLKGGTTVTVKRADAGWRMIETGDGRTGWVHSKFLRGSVSPGKPTTQ